MTSSIANVQTVNASRYLQQLCKHWSHRFTVDFTPKDGTIDFGGEQHVILKATDTNLAVHLHGASSEITDLQKVVEDHIRRFAFREELEFGWVEATE